MCTTCSVHYKKAVLNPYLSYYNQFTESGKTYYRLKAVFLPTDMAGSLTLHLLKLLGTDLTHLFNIATAAPDEISQGTEIWSVTGVPWVAPETLHKVYTKDIPTLHGTPIGDLTLQDLFGAEPYIIYTASLPVSFVPEQYPLEASGAVVQAASGGVWWTIPEGYSVSHIIACAGFSNFPAWTTVTPEHFYVFQGCDYVYNADFRKLHASISMAYYAYSPVLAGGLPTKAWRHNGHRFLISCCNATLFGFPIVKIQDGYLQSIETDTLVCNTPSFIFTPIIPVTPGFPGLPFSVLNRRKGKLNLLLQSVNANLCVRRFKP